MRAKMKLISIAEYEGQLKELKFNAVHGDSPEDNSYAQATPSGELRLSVTNLPAIEGMKIGDKFFLDFTKAM